MFVVVCLDAQSSLLPGSCPLQHDIKAELDTMVMMMLAHIGACTSSAVPSAGTHRQRQHSKVADEDM